ncbi:hypothetical protein CPB83DRAFT_840606 [Crepidotus variabilis]|uniref:Uncharacterized protein n=1 Tax=Crepidotus variabilis TaxID=179855 RepID=A0A9P6E4B9_9AGAR|nr:hypothetical protein CPB83DRAFT_840606 [Crepidotus variabilis]
MSEFSRSGIASHNFLALQQALIWLLLKPQTTSNVLSGWHRVEHANRSRWAMQQSSGVAQLHVMLIDLTDTEPLLLPRSELCPETLTCLHAIYPEEYARPPGVDDNTLAQCLYDSDLQTLDYANPSLVDVFSSLGSGIYDPLFTDNFFQPLEFNDLNNTPLYATGDPATLVLPQAL